MLTDQRSGCQQRLRDSIPAALALGCSIRELPRRYAEACEQPIKPELKKQGPVQEQVSSERT